MAAYQVCFRPYKNVNTDSGYSKMKKGHVERFKNSGDDSDNEQLDECLITSYDQTLLYVHQEKWQQDLLVKYVNTITLLDAAYKTTKYDLALFFVCVKTNVNYTVVADFIVQSETSDQIKEALDVLKSWNPAWKPPYFMSDYSEAQITALRNAFPDLKTYCVTSTKNRRGLDG
jgi:hypothetical protein